MKQTLRIFLFYFAAVGWTLGLLVHALAILNFDVAEKVPFVWILHIGIFVVWFPTIFDIRENEELTEYLQSKLLNRINPFGFFKILFKYAPTWLTVIAIVSFIYAFINFIFFFFTQEGTPLMENGQYILQQHGKFIKIITEQEYHHYNASELRGFSGHWLAFYGMAMPILFPFSRPSRY